MNSPEDLTDQFPIIKILNKCFFDILKSFVQIFNILVFPKFSLLFRLYKLIIPQFSSFTFPSKSAEKSACFVSDQAGDLTAA